MTARELSMDMDEVVRAMDEVREANEYFLDLQTGDVVTLSAATEERVQQGLPVDDLPEWQQKEVPLALTVHADKARYRHIPRETEAKVSKIMRAFARDKVEDRPLSAHLQHLLNSRNGVQRFRSIVLPDDELRGRWLLFERLAKRHWIVKWLRKLGIAPVHADRDAPQARVRLQAEGGTLLLTGMSNVQTIFGPGVWRVDETVSGWRTDRARYEEVRDVLARMFGERFEDKVGNLDS